MAVTAAMVKELREMTGAGMMECKKALTATDGDMDKAVEFLRENGLATATKKAGRIASEGLTATYVSEDNNVASIVEVNSETDFVAKNQEFKDFVKQVSILAAKTNATDLDGFLAGAWELEAGTIKEALVQKIAKIGENLSIRRFVKLEKQQAGCLVNYLHGEGRISVLLELACDKPCDAVMEAGKNVAMQVAALKPQFANRNEVPAEFIEKEREIIKATIMNDPKSANKPENIIAKMIDGKIEKELKEICLVDQQYVKDGDLTVQKYLDTVAKEVGVPISVVRFVRFETGEGLEKKEEDFAAEVAKTMGN